jgi:hypothetical protein
MSNRQNRRLCKPSPTCRQNRYRWPASPTHRLARGPRPTMTDIPPTTTLTEPERSQNRGPGARRFNIAQPVRGLVTSGRCLDPSARGDESSPLVAGRSCDRTAAMVIFGVTGDLTSRKLMPALYDLAVGQPLPEDFRSSGFHTAIGVTTTSAKRCANRSPKTLVHRSPRTPGRGLPRD